MQKIARFIAVVVVSGAALEARAERQHDAARVAALNAELRPAPVPGVGAVDVDPTSATIEWPATLGAADRFRVEIRHLFLNADRELDMQWEEFRSAMVSRHGDVFRARLRGLQPQQPQWIRVLPLRDAGAAGEPLFVLRFDTPARTRYFTRTRVVLGALFSLLAAALWVRWYQRRS